MMLNILLADDHTLFRDSMSAWLNQLEGDVHIYHAATYDDVVNVVKSTPDLHLILLDLNMPGMKGASSVEKVIRLDSDAPVAIMSADENPDVMRRCMNAGAAGYLPKASDGSITLAAIQMILAGGSYFPSSIADAANTVVLNNKQHEILGLLSQGFSNKEIACKTNLAGGTVKQYVSDILRKLGVNNRTQAGIKAHQLGMLGD